MVRHSSVPILRVNMVTAGIDFFTSQSNGQLLIFDTLIKWCCDNEQIAQGYFWYTVSVMIVLTKGFFVFIAPDK